MTPIQRSVARRKLDDRLGLFKALGQRPPRGWIRAIRDALGMTLPQLAGRMNVSASAAIQLEQSEARGAINLATLERAARALDCTLVYAPSCLEPRWNR